LISLEESCLLVCGATSQKTALFIVTAVKTSNLDLSYIHLEVPFFFYRECKH
jgi:hypothetical protein